MRVVLETSDARHLPLVWHLQQVDVAELERLYNQMPVPVLMPDGSIANRSNGWVDEQAIGCGRRFREGQPDVEDWLFVHRSKHGNLGKVNYQRRAQVEAVWSSEHRATMIAAAQEDDDVKALQQLLQIPMIGPGTATWFRCAATEGACPVIDIHAATALAGWRAVPAENDFKGIGSFIDQVKWHARRIDVTVRALDRAMFAAGSWYCREGRDFAKRLLLDQQDGTGA